jgi:hypothetical protein
MSGIWKRARPPLAREPTREERLGVVRVEEKKARKKRILIRPITIWDADP